MGDGIKVPEYERPPMVLISKRLDERISRNLQKLFVIDLQNDCGCSIERYDADIDYKVSFVSDTGIKTEACRRICLPMLPDISEQNILQLLEEAGKMSTGKWVPDIYPAYILYNPNSDMVWVGSVFAKYIDIEVFKDRSVSVNFVPKDQVWLLPDPEFFGCISANIDKFGAFCISRQIVKINQ